MEIHSYSVSSKRPLESWYDQLSVGSLSICKELCILIALLLPVCGSQLPSVIISHFASAADEHGRLIKHQAVCGGDVGRIRG
jgi:hypothetical protein